MSYKANYCNFSDDSSDSKCSSWQKRRKDTLHVLWTALYLRNHTRQWKIIGTNCNALFFYWSKLMFLWTTNSFTKYCKFASPSFTCLVVTSWGRNTIYATITTLLAQKPLWNTVTKLYIYSGYSEDRRCWPKLSPYVMFLRHQYQPYI